MKSASSVFSKIKSSLINTNHTHDHESLDSTGNFSQSKSVQVVKQIAKVLNHPVTRTALVATLVVCVCATSTYAQTGIDQTSNTIETTIKNLFTQIYDNFRIPISAVALSVAAYNFGSGDPNGPKRAGLIGAAILLFWIIPGVITFFTDVTTQ